MTALEWTLIATLGAIYFALLFTVAVLTFQKRRIALFVFGFIFPFLWLIGAMLPPRGNSTYHGAF